MRGYSSLATLNASAPLGDITRSSTPALSYASSISPLSPQSSFGDLSHTSQTFGDFKTSLTGAVRQPRPLHRMASSASLNSHAEYQPNLPQRSGSWQTLESALPPLNAKSSSSTTIRSDYTPFSVLDDLGSLGTFAPIPPRAARRSTGYNDLRAATPLASQTDESYLPPSRRSSTRLATGTASKSTGLHQLDTTSLAEYGTSSSLDSSYTSAMPSAGNLQSLSTAGTPFRTTSAHPTGNLYSAYGPFVGPSPADSVTRSGLRRKQSFSSLRAQTTPSSDLSNQFVQSGSLRYPAHASNAPGSGLAAMPTTRSSIPSPMKSMPSLGRSKWIGYPDLSMMGGIDRGMTSGVTTRERSCEPNPRPRKVSRMVSHAGLAQYEGSGRLG